MSVSIGQTIDSRYRVDQEIAVGGMGAVYRATDLRLGKAVALKVLKTHYTNDPGFQQRFRSEAQTLAMLEHPNIVQVTDFAERPGLCYLVMELITGGSFSRLLKPYRASGQWLPEQAAIELCRQAAEGLACAHAAGVIHRDIKPDNLLFVKVQSANGTVTRIVKIADFGIARLRQGLPGAQQLTTLGSFIGTLGYAPLEQLEGRPLDERSDIYALGAVFYELLTGAQTVTFAPTETDHQCFIKALDIQRAGRIMPAQALRPGIRPAILAILGSCLASDPALRFAGAAALSAALEAALLSTAAGPTRLPTVGPVRGTVQMDPKRGDQLPPTARVTQSALAAPRVRITDAQGLRRDVDLSRAGLSVGRAADNMVALTDQAASGRHLQIDWDGAQVRVTDLGSTNGTLLNGQRLSPHAPTHWPWQASIQVGGSFLQLDQPAAGTQPIARPGLTVAMTQSLQAGAPIVIDVEPGQQALTLTPGQPQPFAALLANAGQNVDHLKVTVEGIPAGWVASIPPQPVALNPAQGNRATLQLVAAVPKVAASKAGDYEVIIRATSAVNPMISATAKMRWTVLPFAAAEIKLSPKRSRGVSQGVYSITIHNNGNATQYYDLSAEDDELALHYRLDDMSALVLAGSSCDVPLTLGPKQPELSQERTHSFTITARPRGGGATLTTRGEYVQETKQIVRAGLPPGLGCAALLLFIALVGILIALMNTSIGGAPAAMPPTAMAATAMVPTAMVPTAIGEMLPDLVEVPTGPFLMGSSAADTQAFDDEKPQHTLALPTYWIGKTEVTNAQFRPFVEGDGYTNPDYWTDDGWQWRVTNQITEPGYWRDSNRNADNRPVVGVSWYEAMAYVRWLSTQTGLDFRLPSEAEWEKAARGTDGGIYPWGNTWVDGQTNGLMVIGYTAAVGTYPDGASPYGALDMAGNVAEWTRSEFRAYPYDAQDGRENVTGTREKKFTIRGGSWIDESIYLRAADRYVNKPDFRISDVGFRLSRHP
ncbi:SUMF1/EgtB/PvdO family nonheme iron enzyme [Chloroflexales bacterium ZM16-3]|nr:SUMF1/EgtB/PvdO family nonheme iron enzyme [Chloroflexales bacterium ZM16-3]